MNSLQIASGYRDVLGWSPIPLLPGSKQASTSWRTYQQLLPSHEVLHRWLASGDSGVAIVTGRRAGVVVIDVDGEQGRRSMEDFCAERPDTVFVQTPRGSHYYFAHPGGHIPSRAGVLPGVDVRADGGYVVVPPTTTEHGRYGWGVSPYEMRLARLPNQFLNLIGKPSPSSTPTRTPFRESPSIVPPGSPPTSPPLPSRSDWSMPVAEGTRNESAARLAGVLLATSLRKGVPFDEYFAHLLNWNIACCKPSLPHLELLATATSIWERHQLARQQRSRRRRGNA